MKEFLPSCRFYWILYECTFKYQFSLKHLLKGFLSFIFLGQYQPHLFSAQKIIDLSFTFSSTVACLPVLGLSSLMFAHPGLFERLILSCGRFTPTRSCSVWILLSAGGTAACWERNAAWHHWKRSWENRGWVVQCTSTAFDLSVQLQTLQRHKHYTLEPRHIRSITLIHPKICWFDRLMVKRVRLWYQQI